MKESTIYNTATFISNDRCTVIPYKGYEIRIRHEFDEQSRTTRQFLDVATITIELGTKDVTKDIVELLVDDFKMKGECVHPVGTLVGTGEILALVFMAIDSLLGEI